MPSSPHIPVMLPEVLTALRPANDETYLDGTFGAGGYSRAILDAADCRVIGLDRDTTAIENGTKLAGQYKDRLSLRHGQFGDMAQLVPEPLDGIVLDIGVSSMQLDQAERGFSFRNDGPLDMRMDSSHGQTAADLVNQMDETGLADLIYQFGDERHSRRIARAIIRARTENAITRTLELAEIVRRALPPAKPGIHPATRTFQALRIAVNDELGELTRALSASEKILHPGGRLVVVTFHSLEDGIVKRFLTERGGKASAGSRHLPDTRVARAATFTTAKPVSPSDDEVEINPRARSARLRSAIRTAAPAWEAA